MRTLDTVAAKTPLIRTSIGLDVSDKFTNSCVLDEAGEIVAEGQIRTTQADLSRYFASVTLSRIALENGVHSAWISRLAESLGHEVIVANARELRKIYQSDRKNDRNDARMLAKLVRVDPELLSPITHRTEELQEDMSIIRARDVLIRARTQCVNTARGIAKTLGIRLTKCSTPSFARKALEQLPEHLAATFVPLCTAISALAEHIRSYDSKIDELAKKYAQTELLRKVTGVGALTSVAYVLTLGDPYRFHKSRDVGAFVGLVPRQDDSGERVSQLRITKAGNSFLRQLIVGSAQYILGHFGPDCNLRRYGERLAARGGKNAKKRAIVAVARKLSVLLHHLWVTGELYDPFYGQPKKTPIAA